MDNTTQFHGSLDDDLERELPGTKHRNAEYFEKEYEVIEKHLKRKVPMTVILEKFNARYGLNVSIARFRQMLRGQRNRQGVLTKTDTTDTEVTA